MQSGRSGSGDPGGSTLAQFIPFVTDGNATPNTRKASLSSWARAARSIAWLTAVAMAAVQILMTPYRPSSEDLVSYLDIADAYRQLHWRAAINGYWSPLYSWVLAVAESIIHPAPDWEFQFVRFVNFATFLLALAAFEWFLARLMASHAAAIASSRRTFLVIPRWMWRLAGYAMFLWASLVWIGLRSDTPDLAATALVLAAAAILLEADVGPVSRSAAAALGAIAGFAFLARTAMVPAALLFIAALAGRPLRRGVERVGFAAATFALVALPFIVGLSVVKHRLTIGESGRMNYVWNVNPGGYIVPGLHWQGGPPEAGVPIHPSRQIWSNPAVFEFEHGEETYPPWTDPSYWYDGLRVRFNASAQMRAIASNAGFYATMFAPGLIVIAVALLCMRAFSNWCVALATQNWKLLIVSGGGLLTYLLGTDLSAANIPTQPSTRYVAVFVLLLFGAIASAIRVPDSRPARYLLAALALVTAVALGGRLLLWSAINVTTMSMPAPVLQLSQVADGLRTIGLRPQSRVAILGRKGDHVFWARVARVHIIDQIPDPDAFLHADPTVQMKVLAALERTGAEALVCDEWSASHPGLEWQRLGNSRYYALPLGGYRQSQPSR